MGDIISFPVFAGLQAAFIQLNEEGHHYLFTCHLFDRRSEILFQTPDDRYSYASTLAKLTAMDRSDQNVVNMNTGRALYRYRIGIGGAVLIERPFIGMAAIGQDVSATQATSRTVLIHDRSGTIGLTLALSELGFHIQSQDRSTHLLFRTRNFDSYIS